MAAGTSTNVALQFGTSWTWCQGTWGWISAGTATTISVDLASLVAACNNGAPDVSQLDGLYLWFSGGGTFYIDAVRAW